jgi:hypothetical protein
LTPTPYRLGPKFAHPKGSPNSHWIRQKQSSFCYILPCATNLANEHWKCVSWFSDLEFWTWNFTRSRNRSKIRDTFFLGLSAWT